VYAGALLVLLLGLELARGVAVSRRAAPFAVAALALVLAANLADLRAAARDLRAHAAQTRAQLGALELARPAVPAAHVVPLPGYPLLVVRAGAYFAAARDLGSPADTPAQLAVGPEPARSAADAELLRLGAVAVRRATGRPRLSGRPRVDAAAGAVVERGACVDFRPARPGDAVDLTVPAAGLLLEAGGGPATIALRRFATAFPAAPHARLAASARVALRVRPDASAVAWHARIAPAGRVTACALP
jgi:hypothetical protein